VISGEIVSSYLLVWKREIDGKIMEAVRLARCVGPPHGCCNHLLGPDGLCGRVEVKRPDGSATTLRADWQILLRNGGRVLFLFCPAKRAVVKSTGGNGIISRVGRTESGKSVGDADLVLDYAIPLKATVCAQVISCGVQS
jgi:hypothetical protein